MKYIVWTKQKNLSEQNKISPGVITKTEMGNVVVAVYELMGIDLRPPVIILKYFFKTTFRPQTTCNYFQIFFWR